MKIETGWLVGHWTGSQKTCVLLPAWPLTCGVTLSMSLHLSRPSHPLFYLQLPSVAMSLSAETGGHTKFVWVIFKAGLRIWPQMFSGQWCFISFSQEIGGSQNDQRVIGLENHHILDTSNLSAKADYVYAWARNTKRDLFVGFSDFCS